MPEVVGLLAPWRASTGTVEKAGHELSRPRIVSERAALGACLRIRARRAAVRLARVPVADGVGR